MQTSEAFVRSRALGISDHDAEYCCSHGITNDLWSVVVVVVAVARLHDQYLALTFSRGDR